jgi:hypothetical protein
MAINSLNQLIKIFEDIAKNHNQIHDYGFGDIWNAGKSRKLKYVCLWLNCLSVTPNKGAGDVYNTSTFRFRVFLMDLVNKDKDNDTEVLSDTVQIAQDILAELNDNPYYGDNRVLITTNNVGITLFREKLEDELNGCWFDIDMTIPYNYCYLGLPLTPKS